MYMLLYCFFISFYNFIYVFSFKDKKMHLLKKNTYYHGVIFVVFFQLKVDIVYFYGFGAVPHLIFYHICKIILSVPQACLGNENGRKVSRRMHYFKKYVPPHPQSSSPSLQSTQESQAKLAGIHSPS